MTRNKVIMDIQDILNSVDKIKDISELNIKIIAEGDRGIYTINAKLIERDGPTQPDEAL